jgi:hypothetical protein
MGTVKKNLHVKKEGDLNPNKSLYMCGVCVCVCVYMSLQSVTLSIKYSEEIISMLSLEN